jgi:hypothetical protein
MSFKDANDCLGFVTGIISTATAMGTTLTAGVALAALGTVGASSAFLALPVLVPAVLVGSIAFGKILHAGVLHKHEARVKEVEEKDASQWLDDVTKNTMTSLRNRELLSGLGLGGVAAYATVVANHTAPYAALGVAGGLSAGLALVSLGLTINAIHDAYFAWSCYKIIELRKSSDFVKKKGEAGDEATLASTMKEDPFVPRQQELARRTMHASIVSALGWAAVTTGSVAAAMSLAPMLVAAAFLVGGIAITGARLYNDGWNFGLFKDSAGAPFSIRLVELLAIRHQYHGL